MDIYAVSVQFKNIGRISSLRNIGVKTYRSGPLKTEYKTGSKYTVAYDKYIIYPNYSDDTKYLESVCFSNIINTETQAEGESGCFENLVEKMNSLIGVTYKSKIDNFKIEDLKFMDDQYLFMTDNNFGIFIFRFHNRTFEIIDEPYLYNLNSNPNTMHFEVACHFEYQLIVNTVKANDVLIFQPIGYKSNKAPNELLKLDRIHAFLIPRYYAFGYFASINKKFLISEMYNSLEKTVSIRVSSREIDTLNDSTLHILDLLIPTSSIIFMGFVEQYSNIFLLVTSKEIFAFSIRKPYIRFDASNVAPSLFDNTTYLKSPYCVKMDGEVHKGKVVVFQKDTNSVVKREFIEKDYYFSLYNSQMFFTLNAIFFGSDLKMKVDNRYQNASEVDLVLQSPLILDDFQILTFADIRSTEISCYVSYLGYIRMFEIFVSAKTILYKSFDYSLLEDFEFNKLVDFIKLEVRGANLISSYLYTQNELITNDYLWTISVVNEKPSFHVFIVSEVISWLKEIHLPDIENDGYKVEPLKTNIHFLKNQNLFVIRGYKTSTLGYKSVSLFYFKLINGTSIEKLITLPTDNPTDQIPKYVALTEEIFYLIYNSNKTIDVFTKSTKYNTYYIEYSIEINNGTQYISGVSCGGYLVMESIDFEFHVFNYDDILLPRKVMTLPVPKGYISAVQGRSRMYACGYGSRIIIPFYYEKTNEDNISENYTQLLYFELHYTEYTSLVQIFDTKLPLEINEIDTAPWDILLLVFVQLGTNTSLKLKLYQGYILNITDTSIPYFLQHEEAVFSITSSRGETSDMAQNITIHGMQSGIVLKEIEPIIDIKITSNQKSVVINLDDYFTGYRKFVELYYPSSNHINGPNTTSQDNKVTDDKLAKFNGRFDGGEAFEFASIQDDHHVQKSLIYLGNYTYLYIDCSDFIYLYIEGSMMTNVLKREPHNLPKNIRETKFLPDYQFDYTRNYTNGTVLVISSIDGCEDVINL
jgi:hypothetical protein